MSDLKVLVYILVMALVTYLIRMIPFVLCRKKIQSKFLQNMLYYVPFAVLGAMTIPAILYSTSSIISAVVGLGAALFFAFRNKSLIVVAVAACAGAFVTELIMSLLVNA